MIGQEDSNSDDEGTFGLHESDQIIEIDKEVDKDENMLPVHFLPEGMKCYDWVNNDLEQTKHENKTENESEINNTESDKAKTKYVNKLTYTSASLDTGSENKKSLTRFFLKAAEDGDIDTVQDILQKNPGSVNYSDNDGYTALHRACYNGHEKTVLYLIEHRANIFCQTNDGWQPIHCAARWNKLEVCKILLDHHADVNATTNGEQTALHFAALSVDSIKMLEMLLLQPNIKADVKNGAGDTPYDLAYRNGPQVQLFDMVDEGLNI